MQVTRQVAVFSSAIPFTLELVAMACVIVASVGSTLSAKGRST